jgi:predicted ribosome quality control (RQC) complex YloA/Tae2 family protein
MREDSLKIKDGIKMRVDSLKILYASISDELTHESIDNNILPSLRKLAIEIEFEHAGKKKPVSTVATKIKPRVPFREYKSLDDILICVGKSAIDNDKLSCDPQHRGDDEWWLHVSGYPGSHVVIRSADDDLPARFPRTVLDAALLAAKFSRATSHKCLVSLTRCRHVRKIPGTPDGSVLLKTIVKSIPVDLHAGAARLRELASSQP